MQLSSNRSIQVHHTGAGLAVGLCAIKALACSRLFTLCHAIFAAAHGCMLSLRVSQSFDDRSCVHVRREPRELDDQEA